MAITYILFDLDNTLYPASSGIMQLFDKRISEYVQNFLQLDEAAARTARHEYYTTYGTTLRGLQAHHGAKVDVEDYLRYVHEIELSAVLALDAELDQRLEQIKAPKAIFTNSPAEHAQRVLAGLGIERHFSHIFDIRFHQFDPKPSAATYDRVLEALDIEGTGAVFVEDTAKNLPPAKALGMTTILLSDQPDDAEHPPADYVVPDVLAALSVVLELEQ